MQRPRANSILDSLKGRIWLAVSGLAVLNCVMGLGAYLLVSFLVSDSSATIFITFFILAFTTMVFGWWLSNEVMRPIDTLTLLAKSLERSPSASIPRTTGAAETDELLQSLHRNGQQLQNLTTLMNDAAAGRIEVSKISLESSDKLSAAFQRLASKITDSITAKQDLDALRAAVTSLSNDVKGVRNGRLNLSIRTDQPQVKEIADALKYLSSRLSTLTSQVNATSIDFERTAVDARSALSAAIEARDEHSSISFTNGFDLSGMISRSEDILTAIELSLDEAVKLQSEDQNKTKATLDQLQSFVSDASRKAGKLRSRSQMLQPLGRTADELAKRSNLIAVNSSILPESGSTFAPVVTNELAQFSLRSEKLGKDIVSLGDGFGGEIAELEKEFDTAAELLPQALKHTAAAIGTNVSYAAIIARLRTLEEQLKSLYLEQMAESTRVEAAIEKLAHHSHSTSLIRESESNVQRLSGIVHSLRDSISDIVASPASSSPRFASPASDLPTASVIDSGQNNG